MAKRGRKPKTELKKTPKDNIFDSITKTVIEQKTDLPIEKNSDIEFIEEKKHLFTYRLDYVDFNPIYEEIKKPIKILAKSLNENKVKSINTLIEPETTETAVPEIEINPQTEQPFLNEKLTSISKDEISFVSEISIEILDLVICTICKYISKDTSDIYYTISDKRAEKLNKAITNYLKTVDVRASPKTMLVIMTFIIFSVPIFKAVQRRKVNLKAMAENKEIETKVEIEPDYVQLDDEVDYNDLGLN